MAYVQTVKPESAGGQLRQDYDQALQRAGKVWNIVRVMSPNPGTLRASMGLYQRIMHAPSPLSRGQREMVAVVVSSVNGCHY